jgi:hypothetical protein
LCLIIVLVLQSQVKELMNTNCPPTRLPSSHLLSTGLPSFPPFITFILTFFLLHIPFFFAFSVLKDWERVVGTVTMLQARQTGGRISAGAGHFSPKIDAESRAHTASYSMGTVSLSLGVKRPAPVDQSLPSTAEAKNKCSYTTTRRMYLLAVHKDNFTFFSVYDLR